MNAVKMLRLDILSAKSYAKSYLLFLVYPVIFHSFGAVSIGIMCGVLFAVLSGSLFSVQEKNHLERLYSVVAIAERNVVLGRYLFMLCNCLFVAAVILPLQAICSSLLGNSELLEGIPGETMFVGLGISFVLFWLVGGIQAPLYFRFGYTKMRMVAYLPVLLIGLGPFLIINTMSIAAKESFGSVAEALLTARANEAAILCIALGVLFAATSCAISLRCYRRAKG